jgi:hypothetical protein
VHIRPWLCTRCGRRGVPRRRGCPKCGAAYDAEFVGEAGWFVQILVVLVVFVGLGALLLWLGAGVLRDLWNVLFGGESMFDGLWFWVVWALKVLVLILIGALGVIALGGAALMVVIGLFGALTRSVQFRHREDDLAGGAELLLWYPVAIVTERLVTEEPAREPALAPLTSLVVRSELSLFIATLWPGTDDSDDDHGDDDTETHDEQDHEDAEDEDGDDGDDELLIEERRVRDVIVTALAAVVGLAARGRVRLVIERVDRVVDPQRASNARSPLHARGLLVVREAESPGADEPPLEQAVLASLPVGQPVPVEQLRDVLESLHVVERSREPGRRERQSQQARELADQLAAYLARSPIIRRDISRVLERDRVLHE